MTQARLSLWQRLDARDRALFVRWVISELTPVRSTRVWRALTHLGGLRCSVAGVEPLPEGEARLRHAAATNGDGARKTAERGVPA